MDIFALLTANTDKQPTAIQQPDRAQPKREPPKQQDIFIGIEKGNHWFEVHYSNGEIRYIQHSTKENLLEYYNRMSYHYKCRKPQDVKPIRYENGQILGI